MRNSVKYEIRKSHIYIYISCLLCCLIGNARTVASESTNIPVIYAGIGVINRNIGTVSDTLGNFILKIPTDYLNDSIRISCVGYKPKTFAVKDIKNFTGYYTARRRCSSIGKYLKPGRTSSRSVCNEGSHCALLHFWVFYNRFKCINFAT